MKKQPSLSEMIEELDSRFVSGNSVDVERTYIRRCEWEAMRKLLVTHVSAPVEPKYDPIPTMPRC